MDVSEFLDVMLEPGLEGVEEALSGDGRNGFAEAHDELLSSCRSCHAVMDRDFIVVVPPGERLYSNQDFGE
jgi:hypothetical protein